MVFIDKDVRVSKKKFRLNLVHDFELIIHQEQ